MILDVKILNRFLWLDKPSLVSRIHDYVKDMDNIWFYPRVIIKTNDRLVSIFSCDDWGGFKCWITSDIRGSDKIIGRKYEQHMIRSLTFSSILTAISELWENVFFFIKEGADYYNLFWKGLVTDFLQPNILKKINDADFEIISWIKDACSKKGCYYNNILKAWEEMKKAIHLRHPFMIAHNNVSEKNEVLNKEIIMIDYWINHSLSASWRSIVYYLNNTHIYFNSLKEPEKFPLQIAYLISWIEKAKDVSHARRQQNSIAGYIINDEFMSSISKSEKISSQNRMGWLKYYLKNRKIVEELDKDEWNAFRGYFIWIK